MTEATGECLWLGSTPIMPPTDPAWHFPPVEPEPTAALPTIKFHSARYWKGWQQLVWWMKVDFIGEIWFIRDNLWGTRPNLEICNNNIFKINQADNYEWRTRRWGTRKLQRHFKTKSWQEIFDIKEILQQVIDDWMPIKSFHIPNITLSFSRIMTSSLSFSSF